jgi:hypothetical protein
MNYSRQQAEAALNDVERAKQRAGIFRGYERGAPQFILWGLIWIVGYGLSDLLPQWSGPVWLILVVCGIVGGYLIGRAPVDGSMATGAIPVWRYMLASAAFFAFMAATYFVMQPHSGAQFGAFPPLVVALIYVLTGIWRGSRWIVAGTVVGALTIIGFALLKEHFMLWMAVVGGGALIVTGLWLKRA